VTSKITSETKFIWTQNSIKEVHAAQMSYNKYIVWQAERQEKEKEKEKEKAAEDSPQSKPGIRIKINTMKKLTPETYDESI
jgi:hypothetical protein